MNDGHKIRFFLLLTRWPRSFRLSERGIARDQQAWLDHIPDQLLVSNRKMSCWLKSRSTCHPVSCEDVELMALAVFKALGFGKPMPPARLRAH